jgi:hypothetical protein
MAINGIGGGGFNPYATGVTRPSAGVPRQTTQTSSDVAVADPKALANAIKSDAAARTAQLNSGTAPSGVDQDRTRDLTKKERSFLELGG